MQSLSELGSCHFLPPRTEAFLTWERITSASEREMRRLIHLKKKKLNLPESFNPEVGGFFFVLFFPLQAGKSLLWWSIFVVEGENDEELLVHQCFFIQSASTWEFGFFLTGRCNIKQGWQNGRCFKKKQTGWRWRRIDPNFVRLMDKRCEQFSLVRFKRYCTLPPAAHFVLFSLFIFSTPAKENRIFALLWF